MSNFGATFFDTNQITIHYKFVGPANNELAKDTAAVNLWMAYSVLITNVIDENISNGQGKDKIDALYDSITAAYKEYASRLNLEVMSPCNDLQIVKITRDPMHPDEVIHVTFGVREK